MKEEILKRDKGKIEPRNTRKKLKRFLDADFTDLKKRKKKILSRKVAKAQRGKEKIFSHRCTQIFYMQVLGR